MLRKRSAPAEVLNLRRKHWGFSPGFQGDGMGGDMMNEGVDPCLLLPLKELILFEIIRSEALINVLDRKGIASKKEFLEEMRQVHESLLNPEQANQ